MRQLNIVSTILSSLLLAQVCAVSQARTAPRQKRRAAPRVSAPQKAPPKVAQCRAATWDGSAGGKAEAENQFRGRALEHRRKWLELVAQTQYMGGRHPLIARLMNTGALTVGALAGELKEFEPQTALLFYAMDGGALDAWLVGAGGLLAYGKTCVTPKALNQAISGLRDALGVRTAQRTRMPPALRDVVGGDAARPATAREAAAPDFDKAVGDLTTLLLPPNISGPLESVRQLIIVPTQGIGAVPFYLLTPFGDKKPLVEKPLVVTVAPSLYDVEGWADVERWDGRIESALIVGNPAGAGLPNAEKEAREVAELLGAKYLTGAEATEREVEKQARGGRDLLYFATHGVASGDDPVRAGFIMLAGDDGEEARWTAEEVQRRGLRSQLVVLSACQTGLGKELGGGIGGLARAFQLAGSPRVVMSLWSVDDAATATLMKSFVSRLRGDAPAEALRLAMYEMMKAGAPPAHWAGFVLFGTPR